MRRFASLLVVCAMGGLVLSQGTNPSGKKSKETPAEGTKTGEKKSDDKKFVLTEDEQQILDLTNAARKEQKLQPLAPNPTLTMLARNHSTNMAGQNKLDHTLDGKTMVDRVRASPYVFSRVGENIAMGDGPIPIATIFQGWMNSPGHRANILQPDFTQIGVGVAATATGRKYYTQVFGRPLR